MRLYVCWDTRPSHPLLGDHPCGKAHEALVEAGHRPEVVHAYGWKALPRFMNMTPGRREVRRLTGSDEVPVLVTDEEQMVAGSERIVEWALANPADD